MTEPIAVDVPKPAFSRSAPVGPASPAPATASAPAPAAPKVEPSKLETVIAALAPAVTPAPAAPAAPAADSDAPVFAGFTVRQLKLGAAAVASLALGVGGVRLMFPSKDAPPVTQPVAENRPAERPLEALAPPKSTLVREPEPSAPPALNPNGDVVVPAAPTLPVSGARPTTLTPAKPDAPSPGPLVPSPFPANNPGTADPTVPPPDTLLPISASEPKGPTVPPPSGAPAVPAIPPAVPPAGGPMVPALPALPGVGPATPPAAPTPPPATPSVPPPAPLGGGAGPSAPALPLVPPPASAAGSGAPATPPATPPVAPPSDLLPGVAPSSPGAPATPPVAPPALPALPGVGPSAPAAPTTLPDVPPKPPEALVPPPSVLPMNPTPKPEPKFGPPDVPPLPAAPSGVGTPASFVKPGGSSEVKPLVPETAPRTSFDVDVYEPKPTDTFDSISQEFYNDKRFAKALEAFNRARNPSGGRTVEVPPLHVLRKQFPQLMGGTTAPVVSPAGGTGTPGGTFPPPPAAGTGGGSVWGRAEAAPARGTYRVPAGGATLREIARTALGSEQRWRDLRELNTWVSDPDRPIAAGTEVKLP